MEQGLLFDFPKFKITKKIRLIELFGGIGSQAMALRDIGADFEHYKLVEFDKYAVQSYNAIHNTQHTTHDIRNIHAQDLEIVEKDKYCYLMTYSFPCTDLSVAGKMQGMSKAEWEKGNSTRSGLLWEVERILKECTELPDVLLMENVPQVHADANKADFDNWCNFLKSKGYINHWQDLNAKDYGIPQNRERCFMVSILSKDFIDFEFPKPVKLEKVMRDFLEESVDEKYYIKNEKAQKLIKDLIANGTLRTEQNRTEQNRTEQAYSPLIYVSRSLEQSKSQIASRQDMTQVSVTSKQMEAVLLSNQGSRFEKKTDIATCLMAREFKGIGNQQANGVIEIENRITSK
jgi:DNA (cytosine-5)-methyltransferase 1